MSDKKKEIKEVDVGSIIGVVINRKEFFFARVFKIEEDVKPLWYRMAFEAIGAFHQPAGTIYTPYDGRSHRTTWILRKPQINGEEFDMGEDKCVIHHLLPPLGAEEPKNEITGDTKGVIPFRKRREK